MIACLALNRKVSRLQVGGLHQRGASVYLFGFLFLHQAVETPKPCKFVKLSTSQVHTLGDTLQSNIKPPCYYTKDSSRNVMILRMKHNKPKHFMSRSRWTIRGKLFFQSLYHQSVPTPVRHCYKPDCSLCSQRETLRPMHHHLQDLHLDQWQDDNCPSVYFTLEQRW